MYRNLLDSGNMRPKQTNHELGYGMTLFGYHSLLNISESEMCTAPKNRRGAGEKPGGSLKKMADAVTAASDF